jgi:site-specific DNA-methyltransferase (cytosine-N4-specific)
MSAPKLTTRIGNVLDVLKGMPAQSVQCGVTSPPYWQLRRYGDNPQELGQEATPEEYVANQVAVFREFRRVLKDDGTLWLNIGDCYSAGPKKRSEKFDGKNGKKSEKQRGHSRRHDGFNDRWDSMTREEQCTGMRNKRDVWFLPAAQSRGAHLATYPRELVLPCVLAGSKPGDMVCDPYGGSGTVGEVCLKNGRSATLIDLYDKHEQLMETRTTNMTPSFF